MSRLTNKTLAAFVAALALALALALGCGSSSSPGEGGAQGSVGKALPAVGAGVGDRIHPFTMRLSDGATVTSTNLMDQDRPTFLLYFKVP